MEQEYTIGIPVGFILQLGKYCEFRVSPVNHLMSHAGDQLFSFFFPYKHTCIRKTFFKMMIPTHCGRHGRSAGSDFTPVERTDTYI